MSIVDIIRAKRDGKALSFRNQEGFARMLADGTSPSEQTAALAMVSSQQGHRRGGVAEYLAACNVGDGSPKTRPLIRAVRA